MKLRASLSLLFVTTLALGACAGGEPEADVEDMAEDSAETTSTAAAEAAITALREDWVTHYNMHHPDMVADFYTAEAVALNADQRVDDGRDAIAAGLTAAMEGEPTASVMQRDVMVLSDRHAVSMGTYQVDATGPDGAMMGFSGTYMNLLENVDGQWKIAGIITNYDSDRPEGWAWAPPAEEMPEEAGTMTETVEAYETHWNLGHPDMVADLYAADAMAAFPGMELMEGRDAIAQSLAERIEGVHIDIHDVWTMDVAEGYKVDAGWFEMTAGEGGEMLQTGMYMLLAEQADDGSWKIKRVVSNAKPAAAM